jgi:flagellar basal body-associated protein FliL
MKKRETSYNYKNKISLAVLLIIVVWFIFTVMKKGTINKNLYQNGEITNAIITNTKKVGGKGIIRCSYSFSLNGTRYEGWADNDYYNVGDTIQILFLKEKPEINRDKKFLDKIN